MPGVTREQIDRAKEWDLLSYLQTYEPGELTKKRPTDKEYRTKTHDSLVISNGRWNWTTRGFGGKTALDYLIKVRGMEFVEAVRTLNDGRAAPSLSQPVTRPPEQPRAFALPEGNRCATAAVSYLQRRGIDSEIISRCIRAGIFFESRKYHNCVFVGRDKAGKARFACLRGTMGDFKGDVPGSDKRFNFCFPAGGPSRTVAVFESPIDALSLATLFKARGGLPHGIGGITCRWAARRRWRCCNSSTTARRSTGYICVWTTTRRGWTVWAGLRRPYGTTRSCKAAP